MSATVTRLHPNTGKETLIRYVDAVGDELVVDLAAAAEVDFEVTRPVRGFTYAPAQKHTPGWYWCATTSTMLAYESWLERNWLVVCDRDPDIVAIATQPMEIDAYTDGRWRHFPDFFVRRADGRGELVDVKHPDRIDHPKTLLQAERTADLCGRLGWGYRLVGHIDPVLLRNLDWLAGYRRPLAGGTDLCAQLLAAADGGATIDALCAFVGDDAAVTRAAIFHLLWTGQLATDLTVALRGWTTVDTRRTP